MGVNDKVFQRSNGRFIPKEELGEALSWQFASLLDDAPPGPVEDPPADAAHQCAFDAGHADGYAAGLAHAEHEAAARRDSHAERIGQVLADLRGRFGELEQHGAEQLLDLALEIARQVVRHDVSQARDALLPLVRESVAQLVDQHSHPRVHLHPADHALIAADLDADTGLAGCRFQIDPAVARGGCRIETPHSVIDASLASRWARAVASIGAATPWRDEPPAADEPSENQPLIAMQTAPFSRFLAQAHAHAAATPAPVVHGKLTRVAGLVMEAVGIKLPIGAQVVIRQGEHLKVDAEVVGFHGERLFLMPTVEPLGLTPGAIVTPADPPLQRPRLGHNNHPLRRAEDHARQLPMGSALLGRVIDPLGRPLDGGGPLAAAQGSLRWQPIVSRPINAMERDPVREPLDVGVRAINALLTVGRGQRMGLFAGSGVGKSVLLGMMARYTTADVIVVGLIGERGREVKEFIEDILGEEGRARAVVVAAPADTPPLLRMQGAAYATAIAEHFRNQGQHVLLLLDSLTRYAMAAREIALAIGEPPATKGYPPSVFAKLPALVERAGNGTAGGGSITAFYTVLTEGDDPQDPVADSARAILDGHVVLSRRLAEAGHYPAIDIEASISRVMSNVASAEQQDAARAFKAMWSRHARAADLLAVGAYAPGNDALLDQAIALQPGMLAFLQQPMSEVCQLDEAAAGLATLVAGPRRFGATP